MSIYFSVRVNRQLVCDCSAYRFPHNPSQGLCKAEVPPIDTLPYQFKITSAQYQYISELLNNTDGINDNHR
jgi:hypothetical protein